ncbi:MAG: protoporphyrinogen oxidase [Terriglobia bacterium]
MAILPQARSRIAVLGGGIAGLTALYRLHQAREAGVPIDNFLIEARIRPGGLILTEHVQDFILEAGPDSFLTEKPEALALAEELAIAEETIGSNDAARRTYLLHRGRLVPLPDGLRLFVPTAIKPAIFSPLVPLASKLQLLREIFLRPSDLTKPRPDESVAAFVRRHYGTGVLENIAEPLLAGIFGGDVEHLSVKATLPRIYRCEQQYGSLTRGMRESSKKVDPPLPLFTSLRGGMGQLVAALMSHLSGSEGQLKFGERAVSIEGRQSSSAARPRYVIRVESGAEYEADVIVSALPAGELSRLIADLSPALARPLGQIPYAPAALLTLGYYKQKTPPGFGYLVPRKEKRFVRACTFVHAKFPGRAPPGAALLRCFLDSSVIPQEDQEIASRVIKEIHHDLGFPAQTKLFRVHRWPAAMPQYHVGHETLLREIRAQAEKLPGIFIAGSFFSGVGISDCIRSATSAAERAVQHAKNSAAF